MKSLQLSHTRNSYLAYVQMSPSKHILVEGTSDEAIFKLLKDELEYHGKERQAVNHVVIDTAEYLQGGFEDGLGNRQKVEQVCQQAQEEGVIDNLVGFVDREFREFDLDSLIDSVACHRVLGRLVWSRGHSIENYLFTITVLRESLRDISYVNEFASAIELFSEVHESALQVACAVGLTGREYQELDKLRNTFAENWEVILIRNNEVALDINEWRKLLKKRFQTDEATNEVVALYEKWLQAMRSTSHAVVRWLCDGHAGLLVLRAVYARCLFEVSSQASVADKYKEVRNTVLRLRVDTHLLHQFASAWARHAFKGGAEYPREVFRLLNLE